MSRNWRACLLGILNGLLYGLVSRAVLWVYAEYDLHRRISESEPFGLPVVQVTYFQTKFPILLIWYVVLFTLASYLAHRYLSLIKRPLLLWLCVGISAIAVWNLLGLGIAWLDWWQTGHAHTWRLTTSANSTEHGLISLAVVVSVNLVFGVIVQLSSVLYGRKDG
jgi:hypothetical protein